MLRSRPDSRTRRSPGRRLLAAWALVGLVGTSACQLPGLATGATAPAAPAPAPVAVPVATWSAADQTELPAGATLDVSVRDGSLVRLDAVDAAGRRLPTAVDGARAKVSDLPPSTTVRATATLVGVDGRSLPTTRTVRTDAAPRTVRAVVTPGDDAVVGIGQPVLVAFDGPIGDRAAVERALTVRTDRPVGDAGWYWVSAREVQYRPRRYWPAGTEVTVTAALAGLRTGRTTWGVKDTVVTFRIGRAQVLRIDDATHQMRVERDGELVRTVPVSLGRHEGTYTTRSGIKTIMSVERSVRMDSSTVGITGSEAYDQVVPYAMRLTWSGEYVHGAPWSEADQGRRNVSHGCTNVSLANARWLFDNSLVGDPVETVGTDRRMEPGNGWGGGWNLDWAAWQAGSALR